MIRRSIKIFTVLFLSSLCILNAGTTGKVAGKVTDSETGLPMPGVNVVLDGTSLGASTDADGNYTILNIPPGIYSMSFSMIGYSKFKVKEVRVVIDLTTNINAALALSIIESEEVTIVAERPVVAKDVSNSMMNISSQTIESLPIQSVDEVLTLQAGIEQGSNGILVRGGSANQTVFMVDGFSLNDERSNIPYTGVALSSIEEIQIQTGGFNAEYGNIRSGLVNVVTKEGRDIYSGTITVRISPAASKHFGNSIYDADSYFNRPYLDPDVAYTGTTNGAWDSYTQRQYPIFEGWNSISESLLNDADPNNDLSPEEAKLLYEYQHRRQGDIKKPDYSVDFGFGGPVPFVGDYLGNMKFYLSHFNEQDVFIFPLSRESFNENNTQIKLSSQLGRDFKLIISGLYGEVYSVSPYNWTTTPTGYVLRSDSEIADLVNSSSGNSILYMPGYFSPTNIYNTNISAKLTQVLSSDSYYELKLSHKESKYNTFEMSLRDTNKSFEVVPGYFVDEAPYGYWGYSTSGVDGMSMGGWMNLGRDDSKITTTSLDFDITSQLNQSNEFQAGLEFTLNRLDINSSAYSPSMSTWTREMIYDLSPYRIAAYFQDKLEFEGFIMNAGVRFDYSSSNVNWYELDYYDKLLSAGYGNTLEDDSQSKNIGGKLYVSPRLGVAHPITDDSKLYFNYGHFRSEASSSYRFRLQRESNGLVTSLGNPNLELEKTVAYEIGYSQNILDQYLLNIAAYYKDITNQPGWIYYQNLNSSVQYNLAANNNYEDIRGFEITLSKTRGSWFRGFINYTYHVETSGYFGYTNYYEDPQLQREYLKENPYQTKPMPRPFARANIEFLTPVDFGPNWGGIYPLEQIRLNVLADWKSGEYDTYNPNDLAGVVNDVQWVDWYNVDLRFSKVFSFSDFNLQFYLDISNALNHKSLNYAGFSDIYDYRDYLASLNFSWEEGVENGDDKVGMYRPVGIEYDPLEANPNNDPDIKARNDKRKEDKSYIDMPNIQAFTFLNPRKITLGVRFDF